MKSDVIIVTPEERAESLSVLGTNVTILASVDDTGGREMTIQRGDEGMGPPPHSHGWDESFYVLSGNIRFICAGREVMCSNGTLVHVPAGTVHAFSYGPGGGEMLEITEKGRATELFHELSTEIPPGPPDIKTVVKLLEKNGVTVHLDQHT